MIEAHAGIPSPRGESPPSPLRSIETAVQEKARRESVDPATFLGRQRMRELLEEEIAAWQSEYLRGLRPFALLNAEELAERAWRNLTGYGPIEPLLEDPDVWEIMINAPDAIFAKRHQGISGYHHEVFHDDEHVARIVTKLLEDSSTSHRKLDPAEGLQDAQLENGARVHIVHSDLTKGGHLVVNVRKFTGVAYRSLAEVVELGMLTHEAAEFLRRAMRARLSVIFAGAPGTGKTTLLSCCANELDSSLRVVIAEEVFETDIGLPNVAHLQCRPKRGERREVDLRRLVAGFLRMAPDVAIVGEVRDQEALALLLTLSSGVTGYATVHAGSARQALARLRFLCQLSEVGQRLPAPALSALVSETVDLVVQTARISGRPAVSEILAVEDPHTSQDSTAFTTTTVFERDHGTGTLCWTGNLPVRARKHLQWEPEEQRSQL
jgi:pilus assembly protein CpaF